MRITKYKKAGRGKYKIFLENGNELTLYEDIILKYEFLLKKDITISEINKSLEENQYYIIYNQAIKMISVRFRSIKEMQNYLEKKYDNDTFIPEIIDRLIKEGYLNDVKFAEYYINDKINLTNQGINKISRDLEKYGIPDDIIRKKIKLLNPNTFTEKINNLIKKYLKRNEQYSGYILKQKLNFYLNNLGYNQEQITKAIKEINFEDNNELKQKEYNKLWKHYSKKYTGKQLEMIISKKLYQKGFSSNFEQ